MTEEKINDDEIAPTSQITESTNADNNESKEETEPQSTDPDSNPNPMLSSMITNNGVYEPPVPSDLSTLPNPSTNKQTNEDAPVPSLFKIDDSAVHALITNLTDKIYALEMRLDAKPWQKRDDDHVKLLERSKEERMRKLEGEVERLNGVVESVKGEVECLLFGDSSSASDNDNNNDHTSDNDESEEKKETTPSPISSKPKQTPQTLHLQTLTKTLQTTTKQLNQLQTQMNAHNANSEATSEIKEIERNIKFDEFMHVIRKEYVSVSDYVQFKNYHIESTRDLKVYLSDVNVENERVNNDRFYGEIDRLLEWKHKFTISQTKVLSNVEQTVSSFTSDLANLKDEVDDKVKVMSDKFSENLEFNTLKFKDIERDLKRDAHNTKRIDSTMNENKVLITENSSTLRQMTALIEERDVNGNSSIDSINLSILQMKDYNTLQDSNITTARNAVSAVEGRVETIDASIVEINEVNSSNCETLLDLHENQITIQSDIKVINDVSLCNTNKMLTEYMNTTDDAITDITLNKLRNVTSSIDTCKSDLSDLSSVVRNDMTETITEFTTTLASLKSGLSEMNSKHVDFDKVNTNIIDRLVNVEDSCTSIGKLKDRTMDICNDIVNLKQELLLQIDETSHTNSTAMSHEMKEEQSKLESSIQALIESRNESLRAEVSDKIKIVEAAMEEIEEKTEKVVIEMMERDGDDADLGLQGSIGSVRRSSNSSNSRIGTTARSGHSNSNSNLANEGYNSNNSPHSSSISKQQTLHNIALDIAHTCTSYEDSCLHRTHLTDLTKPTRALMTSASISIATIISTQTDEEAIDKTIKNLPSEVLYTDSEISERRAYLLTDFINLVTSNLNSYITNVIRREARDKFMRKFTLAVDMALSKHDQVLVTGATRVGRVGFPVCIACDRPLAVKGRVRDVLGAASAASGGDGNSSPIKGNNKNPMYIEDRTRDVLNRMDQPARPETGTMMNDLEMNSITSMTGSVKRPGTSGGFSAVTNDTIYDNNYNGKERRPGTSGSVSNYNSNNNSNNDRPVFGQGFTTDTSSNSGGGENKFVYRGGFKMPKPGVNGASLPFLS